MITRAKIEKLGALHAVEPAMLSLYLAVPSPTDLAVLTTHAGELITAAEAACGRPMAARDRDWVLDKPGTGPDGLRGRLLGLGEYLAGDWFGSHFAQVRDVAPAA